MARIPSFLVKMTAPSRDSAMVKRLQLQQRILIRNEQDICLTSTIYFILFYFVLIPINRLSLDGLFLFIYKNTFHVSPYRYITNIYSKQMGLCVLLEMAHQGAVEKIQRILIPDTDLEPSVMTKKKEHIFSSHLHVLSTSFCEVLQRFFNVTCQ